MPGRAPARSPGFIPGIRFATIPVQGDRGEVEMGEAETEKADFPVRPWQAAWIFWVGIFLVGAIDGYLLPEAATESAWVVIGFKAAFNALVLLWISADARSRGWDSERVLFYGIFAMVLTEIAVPVYLVKSRGWKGAGRSALRFLGYLVLLLIAVLALEACAEAIAGPWGEQSG